MNTSRLVGGLILFLALCLGACNAPAATPQPEVFISPALPTDSPSLPTPTIPAPPTAAPPAPSPTPQPPDPAALPPASYQMDAVLDYARHSLTVAESIDYPNRGQQALDNLLLVVEPNRWQGAFLLQSLAWADGSPVQDYTLEANLLHLPLPAPLLPGERVQISLTYTLNLPRMRQGADQHSSAEPFGYSEHQTNLVDWFAFVPPYHPAQGWLAHANWYYGEHQVYEMADFQVELTLAEPVEGLVIAASAPAVPEGERLVYQMQGARNLVFSLSQMYQVQTVDVEGVTVSSYYFGIHAAGGEMALQNTADALRLYSQRFGPYPYTSLSVVDADFEDGMEYSGLYFLSGGFYNLYNGTPNGYLTAIAAHETAHQWWYGVVGNDQALEPWLDEALCTYTERLFYETVYPDSLTWWWGARVNFYQPTGLVNLPIYDYTGAMPYRDSVYLHGALFLEDLRTLMGDDAFFAFLADYASQRAGQIATASDFFAILEEHTSADLSPLLVEYFGASENLP